MKAKLFVHLCQYSGDISLHSADMSSCYPLIKEVTIELPDDTKPSQKKCAEIVYLWELGEAERVVEEKRRDLFQAEEALKNMLALEHQS